MTAERAAELPEGTPTWRVEQQIAAMIADPVQPRLGRTGADQDLQFAWFPIGHQLLMVPCVAIGEWMNSLAPDWDAASERWRGPVYGAQFWSQFLASFLSPLAGALAVLALLGIARTVGGSRGGISEQGAVTVALVAAFATQFLPGTSETMSNMPGSALLYAAVLAVARFAYAEAGAKTLALGGLAAGAAVLVRYPHALAAVSYTHLTLPTILLV